MSHRLERNVVWSASQGGMVGWKPDGPPVVTVQGPQKCQKRMSKLRVVASDK